MPNSPNSELRPSLSALSSLLPNNMYKVAANDLVQYYIDQNGMPGGQLLWADFQDGKFTRGGGTTLNGTSTRLFVNVSDDKILEDLLEHYPQDPIAVGQTILSADGHWLFWFTSRATSEPNQQPAISVRGFCIDLQLFGEILQIFDRDAGLTKAERRATFYLVGGLTLAESAARDNVAIETKRTQIKQSCTKLNCRGQTQLVKLVMGQLAYLISITSAETSSVSVAEEFVKKVYA